MEINFQAVMFFLLIIGIIVFLQKCDLGINSRGGNNGFTAEQIGRAVYSATMDPTPVKCSDTLDTLNAVNLPASGGGDCTACTAGYNLTVGGWKYVEPNGGAYDGIKMIRGGAGVHNIVAGSHQESILNKVIPESFMTKSEAIGGYKRRVKHGGLAYVSIGGSWHKMGK